jgi:hypothetical protein
MATSVVTAGDHNSSETSLQKDHCTLHSLYSPQLVTGSKQLTHTHGMGAFSLSLPETWWLCRHLFRVLTPGQAHAWILWDKRGEMTRNLKRPLLLAPLM